MIGNPIGYPIGGVELAGLNTITGQLAVTEADDGVVSASALQVKAAASVIEAADTISATAAIAIAGALAVSEASDTLSGSGALKIIGADASQEASDTVSATAVLTVSATASLLEANDTLAAAGFPWTEGQLNITEANDVLFADSTIRLPNFDSDGPPKHKGHKRPSRKDNERLLEHALAKAFEPKRRKIVKEQPWLAEPILSPVELPVPEFNPTLAALHGEMANLQNQLARIQFNRAQEEADDELLLLAL